VSNAVGLAWAVTTVVVKDGIMPIVIAGISGFFGVKYGVKKSKALIDVELEKLSKVQAFTLKSDLYIQVATLVVRMRKEALAIKLHRDFQGKNDHPELSRLAAVYGEIDSDKVEAIGNLFGELKLGDELTNLVAKRNNLVGLFNRGPRIGNAQELNLEPEDNLKLGILVGEIDELGKEMLAKLRSDLNV
jgi:hypothetical protein